MKIFSTINIANNITKVIIVFVKLNGAKPIKSRIGKPKSIAGKF